MSLGIISKHTNSKLSGTPGFDWLRGYKREEEVLLNRNYPVSTGKGSPGLKLKAQRRRLKEKYD